MHNSNFNFTLLTSASEHVGLLPWTPCPTRTTQINSESCLIKEWDRTSCSRTTGMPNSLTAHTVRILHTSALWLNHELLIRCDFWPCTFLVIFVVSLPVQKLVFAMCALSRLCLILFGLWWRLFILEERWISHHRERAPERMTNTRRQSQVRRCYVMTHLAFIYILGWGRRGCGLEGALQEAIFEFPW